MRNLSGKVAFVTGGASGIGLGMVRAFLGEGMKVVIADWNEAHLAEARATLAGSNAVHFVRVDVSDRDQVRAAAQEALDVFGRIHILCNNAGVAIQAQADDDEFEQWDKALSINLGGVVNGCKIIVPIIKAQGEGGHIVNTASMAGMVPLPGAGVYSTAKYAVRGLSESLRLALAEHGIGVSCLFPGATASQLQPVPESDDGAPAGPEGERLKMFWAAMRGAMTPLDMGRRVVEGIRENRFHLVTHREFLEEVRERHREIEEAFPIDDEVSEGRRAFEQARRDEAKRRFALPAKD